MAVSSYLRGNMSSFRSDWQEQLFHLNSTRKEGLTVTHIDGQLDAATTRGRERARMALLLAVKKKSKETRIIHMMRHSKRYDIIR
jgi:hypothetical protein